MTELIEDVVLHETTQQRYLNYALSVITSRALPDVRDGLKPVQRRILYAMYHNLSLVPDSKHRKSAAVVGEVMAKYHPHGDQSIYDAMVRMAQSFSLRYPLVDGQGNFGSLDGDGAAAMRYTEAKLRHVAVELLAELKKRTVEVRQNYDGTLDEPVVLPAQLPNLLVNGASGIAVGMATNIPPHHLGEVISACLALIDNPTTSIEQLVRDHIKGPDFPNSPSILNSEEELLRIYTTGSGPIEMRANWELEQEGKRQAIVITSIPYGLNKATLITEIAGHIQAGRVPQLTDIRDESTDEIRIVMEYRKGADPEAAMAFLFKRTPLQSRFNVNMTCLVPVDGPLDEQTIPRRLDIKEMLEFFLEFRYAVTRRRLQYDLELLERRIHILRGFAIIFDALDEAIRLIRESDGKNDARERLCDRFGLDYDQAEAVLETRLYRLAKMEIDAILAELAEKEEQAAAIRAILADDGRMWDLIRAELEQIRDAYADERLSRVTGPVQQREFSEEVYIVEEDSFCIVTRQGWFKRQKSYTDVAAIRVREGDAVGWVVPATTRHTLCVLTSLGRAYTLRVADIPQTTGYGEAIQTRFDFADGETIVGVITSDTRCWPPVSPNVLAGLADGEARPPWIIALSRAGRAVRIAFEPYAEPSTRAGRIFMKLDSAFANDAVLGVHLAGGHEIVSLATDNTSVLLFPIREINLLSGPGKGVMAIKLGKGDHVVGFELTTDRMHGLRVRTDRGREETVRPNKFSITSRGNRGRQLSRTGRIVDVIRDPVVFSPRPADAVANELGPGPVVPDDTDQGELI